MANHIFTVNETTFNTHLKYMFAGTGKGEGDNGSEHQEGALIDILAIRPGDNIIFYVQGYGFYGVFRAKEFTDGKVVLYEGLENHKLKNELGNKILTYRIFIEGNNDIGVFEKGSSEWNAIENSDNIKNNSVYNMQWSWIFKKLNGNRGCLTIPDDEFNLLIDILSKDNEVILGNNFAFSNGKILLLNDNSLYGKVDLINTDKEIYGRIGKIGLEQDLRKFFTSNLGKNSIFKKLIKGEIKEVRNEIKCSFGEKSIDLLISTNNNDCYLIELKNDFLYSESIYIQLMGYSRWISSYKSYNNIFPILILKEPKNYSPRGNAKKFKFLGEDNLKNNITSEWYNSICNELKISINKLEEEGIDNLGKLKIYIFSLSGKNIIKEFNLLIK